VWFVVLVLFSLGLSQEIKITAKVDKNPVGLNEQFVYEVEISGSVQNLPEVQLPDLSQFAVLGGPNVSTSFQIINFNMSASKTYSIVLMPKEVGTFRIEPARVNFKGKTYNSNSIELTVVKQSKQQPQRQIQPRIAQEGSPSAKTNISKDVFLKVVPSKKSVYVNEEVTLSYKVYFRQRITDTEIVKLPEAAGCWVEEYPIPQRPRITTEIVNGVQYNVAEIRRIAVFPSRSGKVIISPMEFNVEMVVPRRRPRDLFEEFFSDPFNRVVTRRLSSGTVEINVLPLPVKGKPANFSGLVGDFKINSTVDKRETQTNEAISYKVNISGKGLLKFLNKLPIEFPPDFEVYEPKIAESVDKSSGYISSKKEFEYVIIPRVPGEHKIKAASITYFNPKDKKYHTLTIPEYTIYAVKGKELAMGVGGGTVLSKEEVRLLGKDIRFIKDKVPGFVPIGWMPHQNWWFYFTFIFSIVLLGVAWIYRNHLEKMSTNIQYARSRRAHHQARVRLREAKGHLKNRNVAEFYGAISKALLGYVADKTNREAAGLMREDVEEIFTQNKVDGELKKEFMSCLDQADFRRFAPGTHAEEDMNDFYKKAENILVRLEKYF